MKSTNTKHPQRTPRRSMNGRVNMRVPDADAELLRSVAGSGQSVSAAVRQVISVYCDALRSGKTLTHPLRFVEIEKKSNS